MLSNLYKNHDINIFHLNIRSLRRHFDELLIYISSLPKLIHVIVLSEVWIQADEINKYNIQDYDLLLQEREKNLAGGLIIYVHNSFRYEFKNLLFDDAEGILLQLYFKSNTKDCTLNILGFYRNCNFTFNNFYKNFETILLKISGPTVITGDFNLCILEQNGVVNNWLSLLSSLGFVSYINEPTRGTRCLDHCYIRDCPNLFFESKLEMLDITDHYGIFIMCKPVNFMHTENYNFVKKIDYSLLSRRLLDQDWAPVTSASNVNVSLSKFYDIYNFALEQSYYVKSIHNRNKKRSPWISDFLINKINFKNKLFRMFKRNRNNTDLEFRYVRLSRECASLIRRQKLSYYSNKIKSCRGDSRSYWKVIKSILKKETKTADSFVVDGNQLSVEGNEYVVANAFNKHFTEMPGQLIRQEFGQDMFELPIVRRVDFDCTLTEITAAQLINTIHAMNNKRSVGLDGISIITIKRNLPTLLPSLLHIINLSLLTGIYPDLLKTSLVVPVHKADDNKIINHYRPISLQNTISKIIENCVKKQLVSHFTNYNLFSLNQYGFIKNRSTDLALERHITEVTSNLDVRKPTIGVYLDFTKAFDLVDLELLLYKLERYGIRNNSLNWFRSFLIGRKQIVKVNGVYSDKLNVHFGVPQGGVLGPNLFVIFINDLLAMNLNSKIYAFADDTSLVCSSNNFSILQSRISKDLDSVSNWIILNRLLINTKKSNAIIFSYKPSTVEQYKGSIQLNCHSHMCLYGCNCQKITFVKTVKYLGLLIDSDLRWHSHADNLTKKLRKINYNLYHMRGFLSSLDLRTLYISWFESVLRYGIIHWGGTFDDILKPVATIQKLALRTVCNVGKYTPSLQLLNYLKVQSFNQIYLYSILMFTKKYSNLFKNIEITRQTRSSSKSILSFPLLMKTTSRNQCYFKCTEIFNKYFYMLDLSEKYNKFKKSVKTVLRDIT